MGIKNKIMSQAIILLFVIGFAITLFVLSSYISNPSNAANSIGNVILLLTAAAFLLSGILIALLSLIKILEKVG